MKIQNIFLFVVIFTYIFIFFLVVSRFEVLYCPCVF